ncbi:GFA family protein [Pelagibacterium montanilacus]|uniref:GFA family protein n=1 Tax=Pelagibacterium montanilacus TaxID=2185280 RepID=UPI000F8ED96F|nr:GFA family protein [Pelagibacterium montanilacus]
MSDSRIMGSCHCGQTRFELSTPPQNATRCTCTFCTKRGVLWIYYDPAEFRLLTPLADQTRYSPTTPENKHYFCPTCGCSTFSDNPDYSGFAENWEEAEAGLDVTRRRFGVNLWLLDDFDIRAVPVIELDGLNQW